VAYHSNVDVPAHVGGTWGSAQDCFDATADTLDFTVATAGNYELNWKVTYYADNAVSSLCQALVGGIRLEQLPAADDNTSAIDLLPVDDASTRTVRTEFYDLNGRRLTTTPKGLYLRRSISADGKSRTQIVQE
jgi:hypothetical protein